MFSSFRHHTSIATTWFFDKVQRQSKLYIPAVQFCRWLSIPDIFHSWNYRTFSKTLKLSEYDRFGFCNSFWGACWQAFIALKHSLFFHIIICWNHLQNIPSLMSLHSLSTSKCWVPAVYPSIENAVPLSSTMIVFSGLTLECCFLICS